MFDKLSKDLKNINPDPLHNMQIDAFPFKPQTTFFKSLKPSRLERSAYVVIIWHPADWVAFDQRSPETELHHKPGN